MVNEPFTNYGSAIFLGAFLCIVLTIAISLRKESRREKPDPPFIFGPIRGMYVCYQFDTIFNTPRCPECLEEAVIPLIRLTGSLIEDERVGAVIGKLQGRSTWKLPIFQTFQDGQAVTPASWPEASNGGASEIPMTIEVLPSKRGRQLS